MPVTNLAYGTGRRKTSVARVYLREGNGQITVNGRDVDTYFSADQRSLMRSPLEVTASEAKYDILINVKGGGLNGQAGACRLGVSRALLGIADSYREILKKNGFLTRDAREVERKKYGQKGARKKFQFSKR